MWHEAITSLSPCVLLCVIVKTGAVLAWAVSGVVDACTTSDECPDVTTVCWRPLGRCISCSRLCAPGRPTQRSCANEPRCSGGSTPAPGRNATSLFRPPSVKRFALYAIGPLSCLSCPLLPVCDVGVLWPNGWMDQNETWHGGRP